MKVLSRYIAKQTIKGIFVAFVIVTSIIMLVDFVEGSRNIGSDADLNAGQVFMLTALKTPRLIEETIPFVVLFGMMGALYGMNRRSELIVMRASGQSAWLFLRPAIFVVFVLGILWTVAVNPLAAGAMSQHDSIKSAFSGENESEKTQTIWLREGTEYEQTIIYAPSFNLVSRILINPEFTISKADTDGGQAFSHRFDAKSARLLNGYWQLTDVMESSSDGRQQKTEAIAIPTSITPTQFQDSQQGSGYTPVWKMPTEISALSQAGFSSTVQQIKFHKLISLPLTLMAMAIIAAGVSMRLTREGGTLRFMLTGAAIGFGVFFIENMIKAFGEAGSISPIMAVWLIPIFVLTCGLTYLSRLEDG